MKCWSDIENNVTLCRHVCHDEKFSLYGMNECHPWLNCSHFEDQVFVTTQIVGTGAVKMVKLAKWKGFDVAVSYLRNKNFMDDFLSNMDMLQLFNSDPDVGSNQVVQLVGFCNQSQPIFITEYHPLGSADKVDDVFKNIPMHDSILTRFSLCIDFVRILTMLHSHRNGTRVFCDANEPEKALSQFLLSPDLHLILNDMDALPIVNEKEGILVKCGQKELSGDFVAPEQIWPHEDMPFNNSMMPGYTEKIDIWKIPDIFNYLLDKSPGSNRMRLHLFNIHFRCKNELPSLRPSAKVVLHEYEQYFKILTSSFHQQKTR